MNAELEEYKKLLVRKAKFRPFVFGFLVVIMINAMTFAYFQMKATETTKKEVEHLTKNLKETQERIDETESLGVALQKELDRALMDIRIVKETAENTINQSTKRK